jgi:hypothetical protein
MESVKDKEVKLKNAESKLASLEQEKKEMEVRLRNELVRFKKYKEEMEKQLNNRLADLEIKLKKEAESKRSIEAELNKRLPSEFEEKEMIKVEPRERLTAPIKRPEEEQKESPEMEPTKTKEDLGKVIEEKTFGSIIGKDSENREIWIDFGGVNGIAEGQTFDVYRKDVKIAELKAIKIFDSFTVTKTLSDEDFDSVEELDEVRIASIESTR